MHHLTSTTCAFNINPHKRTTQTQKTGKREAVEDAGILPKTLKTHDEENSVETTKTVSEGRKGSTWSTWKDQQGEEKEKSG